MRRARRRSARGAYTIATIDLGGYLLTVADGMRAKGRVLWVTRGAAGDTIDRVALCPSYDCGTVVAGTPDPALSFPTDVELRGDRLLVVNSQFDHGLVKRRTASTAATGQHYRRVRADVGS